MVQKTLSRRRFIQIIGAISAGAALPVTALADRKVMTTWSGISLGADANIQLFYPNQLKAKQLLRDCLQEINRLEKLFSLYRPDSTIVELNTKGIVKNPPAEFVQLLRQAEHYSELTKGAFDITVQPLWESPDAKQLVGYKQLQIEDDAVFFTKPHMQITLNGIAQGFITDKVVALLKQAGITNALVNLGEQYAIGTHPKGRNWHVGVTGKSGIIELNNQAIATSSNHDYQHIINPKTGEYAKPNTITVIANTATKADALSTAFAVMPSLYLPSLCERVGVRAFLS